MTCAGWGHVDPCELGLSGVTEVCRIAASHQCHGYTYLERFGRPKPTGRQQWPQRQFRPRMAFVTAESDHDLVSGPKDTGSRTSTPRDLRRLTKPRCWVRGSVIRRYARLRQGCAPAALSAFQARPWAVYQRTPIAGASLQAEMHSVLTALRNSWAAPPFGVDFRSAPTLCCTPSSTNNPVLVALVALQNLLMPAGYCCGLPTPNRPVCPVRCAAVRRPAQRRAGARRRSAAGPARCPAAGSSRRCRPRAWARHRP